MTTLRTYHVLDEDGNPVPVDAGSVDYLIADIADDLAHHLRHTQRDIDDCDDPALLPRLQSLRAMLQPVADRLEEMASHLEEDA
jgi:hypothetical protein